MLKLSFKDFKSIHQLMLFILSPIDWLFGLRSRWALFTLHLQLFLLLCRCHIEIVYYVCYVSDSTLCCLGLGSSFRRCVLHTVTSFMSLSWAILLEPWVDQWLLNVDRSQFLMLSCSSLITLIVHQDCRIPLLLKRKLRWLDLPCNAWLRWWLRSRPNWLRYTRVTPPIRTLIYLRW